MNNNETIIKDDMVNAINNLPYTPFCTNCGSAIGNFNKCLNCGVKTKKNHKKFCVYCGGNIGINKKCDSCGTLSRNTLAETFARLFIKIHIIINYVAALFCWICALISMYKYKEEAKFLLIFGFIILISTLIVHVLAYRKKQMQKIKLRLFRQKRKTLKLVCIYVGIIICIISVLNISILCGVVRLLNMDEQRVHKKQLTEIKKQQILDKESIDIFDGIIAEASISNVNIRLLEKEIMVLDMENNELALVIVMNAPFGEYGEIFDDDGNVTLAHNGDYKPISVG